MVSRLPLNLARLAAPLLTGVLVGLGACSSETTEIAAQPQPAVPAPPDFPDAEAEVPDAAPEAAPPKPKPIPTFPQVLNRGGQVRSAPRVQPIVFPGDELAEEIADFTTRLGASSYWKGVATEYGVGPITALPNLTVAEAAPTTTTYEAIEAWLIQKLSGASPAFGAPEENTLYAIYYPASTTITADGAGAALGQSCEGYGGYHFEVTVGTKHVGYAVMPRCADLPELTVTASHEYFEWATNPFPRSAPTFSRLDDAHLAWEVVMFGELGDLCSFLDTVDLTPPDVGYRVQRMWSNKLSLAGRYPCTPVRDIPYIQAIPSTPDDFDVPNSGSSLQSFITTKAINVPPGGSRTVDVLIYSDRTDKQQVPVRAISYADFNRGGTTHKSGFTFSLSNSTPSVGDVVELTIKAPKEPSYDLIVMASSPAQRTAHYWPVFVVNDGPIETSGGSKPQPARRGPDLSALLGSAPRTNASRQVGPNRIPATTLGMRRY